MRMVSALRGGERLSNLKQKGILSQYAKILPYYPKEGTDTAKTAKNNPRWLLRRGSPLPIPNREVKPACADGTAILWESMSPPSFEKGSRLGTLFCFVGFA